MNNDDTSKAAKGFKAAKLQEDMQQELYDEYLNNLFFFRGMQWEKNNNYPDEGSGVGIATTKPAPAYISLPDIIKAKQFAINRARNQATDHILRWGGMEVKKESWWKKVRDKVRGMWAKPAKEDLRKKMKKRIRDLEMRRNAEGFNHWTNEIEELKYMLSSEDE